jgi:hypothetical protein
MITLQNGDKLMTMSEVLANVKKHLKDNINYYEYEQIIKYDAMCYMLSAALEEDEEFIRGTLK